ncbi:hypothetical protein K461DRAFT_270202 [Myriangium duriaei CBS 260.36]|uniref:Uncharacterized protein n=1 Tax=Myriangium duriaei CBS 260.36 TaxID=1168546 RepID=A0A9P4MF86_9PEZI|nr:hypothetical protein K461DRAFT_270202 [Myriangium duriaei CBS 260.36]
MHETCGSVYYSKVLESACDVVCGAKLPGRPLRFHNLILLPLLDLCLQSSALHPRTVKKHFRTVCSWTPRRVLIALLQERWEWNRKKKLYSKINQPPTSSVFGQLDPPHRGTVLMACNLFVRVIAASRRAVGMRGYLTWCAEVPLTFISPDPMEIPSTDLPLCPVSSDPAGIVGIVDEQEEVRAIEVNPSRLLWTKTPVGSGEVR